MNNQQFSGKVAIVTGASHGIGVAIARRLAADGAHTVVNYHSSADDADKVVAQIKDAGGRALAVGADMSDPAQIVRLFDEAEKAFGIVSLLVNNAAVRGDSVPAPEIDLGQYEKVFNANIRGPILCIAEFARRLGASDDGKTADGDCGGAIVNITSGQARTPLPGAGLYAGAKGALESVTRAFAADLGPHNIRVNGVAPGATGTEVFKSEVPQAMQEQTIKNTALGRLGTPADIADAVALLLSEDAHWITGQILDANGGLRR